jgi:membrane-bound serine protease (ClpP class)
MVMLSSPANPSVAQDEENNSSTAADKIWAVDIDGIIGPATADYLVSNLQQAVTENAHLLLVRLDTPGGLDKSMRQMIKAIISAEIPVVIYVAPSGARAASAGTYLLYASHIAAMAPATNLGAATPVQMGSPVPGLSGQQSDDGETNPAPLTTMEKKLVNDAVAYIQSLAELRGRNKEWAEAAVRQGMSLSADAALGKNVIDIVADNQQDLLNQLHQRTVTVNDQSLTLDTKNVSVNRIQPDWRNQFLAIITNPNVAYILMLLGIYGLIFELSNPGLGVSGLAGVVSLLLALYAFQVLPVSYVGVALILFGVSLMVFEAFSPTFGIAGVGGLIAFVIGSITLMDSSIPAFQIAWPVILAVTTVSAGLLTVVLGMLVRSTRQRVVSGMEALRGRDGVVESSINSKPLVRVAGELWQAQSESPLAPGDRVRILNTENLHLIVEKL